MNEPKRWFLSRTIWLNAVIVVLAILDALQAIPSIPATWLPYIVAAGGVLNVVLRLTTSSGISGFAPAPMRAPRSGTSEEDAPTPDVPDRAPSLAETIAADNGLDPEVHQ